MREKDIENFLIKEVKKLGGTAYKFTSPGRRSVPDRLCVLPNGVLAFVECKAPGEEPTEAQYREIERIGEKGHWVMWVDSNWDIIKFINKAKQMIGDE